jgi:hypothetical protein
MHRVGATRSRFSTSGPASKRGTVLTFRLRRPGTVVFVVRRADCSVVGRKRVHGTTGLNRVRFNGRVHCRPLAPGRYTIDLLVVRGPSKTRFGALAVEVVPPNRQLTKAERTAPVVTDCLVAIAAPALPVAIASTAGPFAAAGTSFWTLMPERAAKRTRTGVLGVSLKPPRVPLPVVDGAPLWLGVFLLVLFALGVTGLTVYLLRFRRRSWFP